MGYEIPKPEDVAFASSQKAIGHQDSAWQEVGQTEAGVGHEHLGAVQEEGDIENYHHSQEGFV